jgi:RND family efflux transporter MFP subunit
MNITCIVKYFFIIILSLCVNTIAIAEEVDAVLSWSKRVALSTPVSGIVQKVFAESGKVVGEGDPLIQLSPRAFKADLKFAKAKRTSTYEQRQEARRELDRQVDMYERAMLSEHDLQVAKNNFIAAKARYQQAQSSLTKAKLNLELSTIRAPFNAIVINVKAVKGQVVASAVTPPILVVVAQAQKMLARFYIAIEKVNDFTLNQTVEINVAGRIYQGNILNISLEPDELKSDHYAVEVVFDTNNALLRAGQKVKITL